jgi:CheY-like chemotaxis protein
MGDKMLARNALLVDDSKSARFVLGKLLQQHDFNVEMAASAEDALEFLSTHRPDAIFMDHLMKGMDGLVATSVIKKNPATAHIPVVMCTSNDGEAYLAEARSHGALGTLVKPPSDDKLEEILIAINKAIDNNQPALETFRPHQVAQQPAADRERVVQTPAVVESVSEAEIEAMVDSAVNARIVLIEESLEAQLKKQREELQDALQSKLDAMGSSLISKPEIGDLLDERHARMSESVADQLGEMKQQLSDEIIGSAKLIRHIQEISMETAISVAEEKAAAVARNVAQSAQSATRDVINPMLEDKISQQLAEVEKSAKTQALTYSALAAVVGAGTAATLIFLVL